MQTLAEMRGCKIAVYRSTIDGQEESASQGGEKRKTKNNI